MDPGDLAEERNRRVSAWYETMVSQALSRYYDPTSFLIDARILFHDMVENIPQDTEITPPVPAIRNLPGLPVLPDEMRAGLAAERKALEERSKMGVRYVDLIILVDTVYSVEDMDFVLELAQMSAQLDTYRGDRVNIRKKLFPRLRRELGSHRLADLPDSLQISHAFPLHTEPHPWSAYWKELPSLLPLVLLLFFLSFMVWLVVRSMRLSRETNAGMQAVAQLTPPVTVPATPSSTQTSEDAGISQTQILQEMRESALNAMIGDPAGSAAVLANWISVHREKGLAEAAVVVVALDRRLLDVLRPHLGGTDTRAIEMHLESRQDNADKTIPVAERIDILRFLLRDLRSLRRQREGEEALADLFGFLRQLSILQLQHILKDEPFGVAGMAIAQLQPERAAALLRLLNREGRSRILVAMGQINPIPVQTYKELAERLSRKALEVANMRFVAADGVQTVLDLLQNLSTQEQREYITMVGEMDMELVLRIRRYYVPWEELPTLPEKVLATVLANFDRDLLATALVETEDGWRKNLLKVLPERMRLMIESTMESRLEQGPAEVERARRTLLAVLRKELQEMGGLA